MKPSANIKLITTEDGSHSLRIDELDETYHSIHGAIQESNHVFIEAGLKHYLKQNPDSGSIKILEYGFGTGLNALLSALGSSDKLKIEYHTLEKYPLSESISNQLNYGKILDANGILNLIHSAKWDAEVRISSSFSIKKIETDFIDFIPETTYELIFFDAFAPSKQAELWNSEIFQNCYKGLKPGGVLVTYSAKGQVKRDLKSVGFIIESIPGPPGKFQMTRGVKPVSVIGDQYSM
ncbi:MAG: tRNA (5-methylaminomethyl-2-thiouridine)(34)-methyltransferase MnmD [Bacteroidota bacterium]